MNPSLFNIVLGFNLISFRIKESQILFLLFCFSILTRSLTSIYYIEDIDSLRFALSLHEYDVLNLQPHFPGYPLFCFIAKLFYLIIGNKGLTFSVIGGISVFFCIYYCLKISGISPKSKVGFFVILIILLNPLFWLMSNRYMPDLLGLAVALGALYYLVARKDCL